MRLETIRRELVVRAPDGGCPLSLHLPSGGLRAPITAIFPGRVTIAASFHAAGLSDDRPSDSHLVADGMRAGIYVTGATHDAIFPRDAAHG